MTTVRLSERNIYIDILLRQQLYACVSYVFYLVPEKYLQTIERYKDFIISYKIRTSHLALEPPPPPSPLCQEGICYL